MVKDTGRLHQDTLQGPPQQQQRQPDGTERQSAPDTSTDAATGAAGAADVAATTSTDDGATIVSQRLGKPPRKRVQRDPLERQAIVKDALRSASLQMAGEQQDSSVNGSGSAKKQWWQKRLQAVYLPSIRHVVAAAIAPAPDTAPAPAAAPAAADIKLLMLLLLSHQLH